MVKLEALRNDNIENLNHPVFALARLDLRKDFPFYRLNLPNISISDKDIRLEYLFHFNYLLRKLNEKFNLQFDLQAIEKFLKKIDREVFFWNLRDISYLDIDHIKSGLFYRSSTLSRYNDQKELKIFFADRNIKTIIDLRSVDEVTNGSYNNIKDLNYVNVPISEKDNMDLTQLKYLEPDSFNIFYELFLRFHQDEIKVIFNTLATADGAFVLHCYAGRDRTGLVVALLLELLGEKSSIISDQLIAEDYLNSGNSTEKSVFEIYQQTLKEFGGAKNYLQSVVGISQENLTKIINKFTK